MEKLFANCKSIAIHSEKEEIVEAEQDFREQYGEDVPERKCATKCTKTPTTSCHPN
jgi:hypothetical protein